MASYLANILVTLSMLVIWSVYAVAPHFMLPFIDIALLPLLPEANPRVASWPLLKDAHIIQLSIVHFFVLDTCNRQVQKRGRALQRHRNTRRTSSWIMLLTHSILAASLLHEAIRSGSLALCSGRLENGRFGQPEQQSAMVNALWFYYMVKLVHDIATGVRVIIEAHPHMQSVDVLGVLKSHPPTYWIWWLVIRYEPGGSAFLPAIVDSIRQVAFYAGKLFNVRVNAAVSLLIYVELFQFLLNMLSTAGLVSFQCHLCLPLYIRLPGLLVSSALLSQLLWQAFKGGSHASLQELPKALSPEYGWVIIMTQCQRMAHAILLKNKSETWGPLRRAIYLILNEKTATWEIPRKGLEIGARIGGGAYGDVYIGKWRGSQLAVKRFKRQGKEDEYERYVCFKEEVNVLNRLRHPRIVEFMGATSRGGELQIVTELLQHGSLFDFLHSPKGMVQKKKAVIDERRAIKLCESIATGMQFLHTNDPPILHMDLQPGNLLMCDANSCKICDFGLSKFKFSRKGDTDAMEPPKGAPQYRAPELIEAQWDKVSEKADVYSFGILMWEILTTKIPWEGNMVEQVFYSVCHCNERPSPLPEFASFSYLQLMQDCWQQEADKRPGFGEICKRLHDALLLLGPPSSACVTPRREGSPSIPGTPTDNHNHNNSNNSYTQASTSPPLSPTTPAKSSHSFSQLSPTGSQKSGNNGVSQLTPVSVQKSFSSLQATAAWNRSEGDLKALASKLNGDLKDKAIECD